MEVVRWDEGRDGKLTEQALQAKLERLGYSVSRYTYPPGTYFPPHTHSVEKMDAVLSGTFRITMGGMAVDLGPGDAILVRANAEHSAAVIGDRSVVSLDAVKVR